jgi:hypothetical protein
MTRTEKLLAELIALPSVNPAFLPPRHPHAGEKRVADFPDTSPHFFRVTALAAQIFIVPRLNWFYSASLQGRKTLNTLSYPRFNHMRKIVSSEKQVGEKIDFCRNTAKNQGRQLV